MLPNVYADLACGDDWCHMAQWEEVTGDVPHLGEESHQSNLGSPVDELYALLCQAPSADSRGNELGQDSSQSSRHTRRVEVTGSFSGDEQHLTHDAECTRPAKEACARSP